MSANLSKNTFQKYTVPVPVEGLEKLFTGTDEIYLFQALTVNFNFKA